MEDDIKNSIVEYLVVSSDLVSSKLCVSPGLILLRANV